MNAEVMSILSLHIGVTYSWLLEDIPHANDNSVELLYMALDMLIRGSQDLHKYSLIVQELKAILNFKDEDPLPLISGLLSVAIKLKNDSFSADKMFTLLTSSVLLRSTKYASVAVQSSAKTEETILKH